MGCFNSNPSDANALPIKKHCRKAFVRTATADSTLRHGTAAREAREAAEGHDVVLHYSLSGTVHGAELQARLEKLQPDLSLWTPDTCLQHAAPPWPPSPAPALPCSGWAQYAAPARGSGAIGWQGGAASCSRRLEIRPQPDATPASPQLPAVVAKEVRGCRKGVVVLLTAGCTWDEGTACCLRQVARCPTPTRLVLVHCVDSCPFPAPGEWPADVRPVIAAHWPPVRYVSQHVGEAAAAVLQRLEAATVGCQAQRQEQKVRLQKQRWWCRTGRRKLQKERKQQQEEHMSGAGSVAGVVGSSGVGCGVSLADLQCGPGSEGGSVSAELDRLRRRARELLLQQACVPLGGCPAGSGAGALAAAAAAAWSRGQGAGADTPWPGAAGAAAAAGGVELHGAAWGPVWGTPVRCEPHALPTPRNELPATGVQPCKPAPPPVAIPSATHGSSPGEQLHAPVEGVAMVHKKASNRFPRLQLPGAICGSAAGDGGSPALWPLVSGRTDESRQDSQQVSPKLRPCKYLLRYMHPAWAVPVSYVCAQLEAGMELGQGEVLLEAAWDGEAGTVGGSCLDGMGACGAEGSVKRVSEAGVVRFGNGPAGDAADAHMQQQQQRQQQTVENQEDREGLPALRLNRLHGGDAEACGSTSAASFRSASSTNESRSHSRRSSSCGASGLGLHTVRAGPGACGAVALGRAASGEVRMQGQVQGPGGALGQLVAAANPLPCRKLQAPLGCAVSGSTSHSRGQGLWATHPQPQQRHQHQQGRPGCEDSERAAAAAVLSSPVSAGGRRGQGGESGPLSPLSPLSPVSSCSVRTGWAAEEDGGQQRPGSGCHATKTATGQAAVRTGGSVGGPRGGAGVWDEGGVAGGGSRMASGDGGACVAMGSRGVGGESSGGSSVVVLFLAPGYVVGSACLRGILGVLRRQQAHKSGGRAGPSVQPAGAAGGGGGAGGKGASLGLGSTGCGDVRLQLVVDADCRQRLPDTRPLDVTTDEWKIVRQLWSDRLSYLQDWHVPFVRLLALRLEPKQPTTLSL